MTTQSDRNTDSWAKLPHEVVLCNFGGPEKPEDVEPFLRRLFEDPFIIRMRIPNWLRRILAAWIAKRRAPRVGAEYAKFGHSPINRMTRAVAAELEKRLQQIRPGTKVHTINRYTAPFANDVVPQIGFGKSRIFVLSLYPHLCHSTTVSSYRDMDLAYMQRHGTLPPASIRINSWWFHRAYRKFEWTRMEAGLAAAWNDPAPGPLRVVFSAHGLPERYFLRGDPYVHEIRAHFADLSAQGQAWIDSQSGRARDVSWHLSFQSRVGPVAWVTPHTEDTLAELGPGGGTLLLVPVSFTADHIETLYEMDVLYRDLALRHGFKAYHRVKPANDDPEFAACLVRILQEHGF